MNLNRRLPGGRTRRRPAARTAGLLAVTASLLVLTACGGDDEPHRSTTAPEASSSAGHNKTDVDFASEMIPHHRQAVEMAGLAGTRASSTKVKELSERIEKAQAPEIRTMTGWLKAWDEKVPAEDDGMAGMDHGDGGGHEDQHGGGHEGHGGSGSGSGASQMPGMMSAEQMDGLKKSKGPDFDRSFLTMMIDHHEGAVAMATAEKKDGAYGPAKRLADAVIAAQGKEISEMNKLLGKG